MPEKGMWQRLSVEQLAEHFAVDPVRGLKEQEAGIRYEKTGPNALERGSEIAMWQMFLNQFKDFMVLILLAATVISGLLGEWSDAVTIAIIILLNAVLGVVQEFRAERSMEALKELTAPEARVVRDGREKKIPAVNLVPGDIVLLEAGDGIPADLRLTHTVDVEVVEATLTGESTPVRKHANPLEKSVAPTEAANMLFMGTAMTRGRGQGMVVSTGMNTEMGHIAVMIKEAGQDPTPLQRRLAQLGRGLVAFCLAVCALVVVLGIRRGEPAYQMFLTGVSLAVAAIPEGLPAIVTVALAIGVQRMIKRHAIIRRLPAVETLGCATYICSDKTGTLTLNEMTVRRIHVAGRSLDVTGEGYDPKGKFLGDTGVMSGPDWPVLMRAAALCNNAALMRNSIQVGGLFRKSGEKRNTAWRIHGDPTEGAILVLAAKAGIWRERLEKKMRRLKELPFDSDRKRMTVVYGNGSSGAEILVKGAPDVVMELCSHYLVDGHPVELDEQTRRELLEVNADMARGALRVIGFAYRKMPSRSDLQALAADEIEKNLVFVGLVGMIDPPRPTAISAVRTCRRAGIKVAMITGDHQLTAWAVAREMGIAGVNSQILTGAQLEKMDDQELAQRVDDVSVYARVSPRHKLRIVRALKQNGHVVAMTGDGVNDAPAVKEADIGIAMGVSGTDVTREASDIVLTDDNFSSIVAAIEEGRGIYDNIRKFIRYLLTCNVGEVLVMLLAVLGGLPLPLVAIQILWMNLVTDGLPAMALGVDPIEKDIMHRSPRHPRESIFSHGLGWRIMIHGCVIGVLTIAVFGLALSGGLGVDLARTLAFNTLVFLQLFFVFACRFEHTTMRESGFFTNPHLVAAVLLSMSLQLAVTYIPALQTIFHTVSMGLGHWVLVLGVAVLPTIITVVLAPWGHRLRTRITYLRV